MTSALNDLLDPSVCSCFPTSYHSMICNKVKWSTISISIAMIIIIVYASSGLYTLIDVTTLMSIQSENFRNETILWPITFSSVTITLGWISLLVYFTVVLFIILLLCGIQLSKPWLLFLWSILMIIMLLVDGIITVLSLRQHQQETHRSSKQVKILFFVMIIRLTVSLCGIFITVFHFRQLNKSKSDYVNRQRMLHRYNTESASPSYDGSWTRSADLLNPLKDVENNLYIPDLPPSLAFPRAKVAAVQRHPTATIFRSRNSFHPPASPPELKKNPHQHQRPVDDYQEDFRYNIPLEERFHQQKIKYAQEL